jgi:hypothetical protein
MIITLHNAQNITPIQSIIRKRDTPKPTILCLITLINLTTSYFFHNTRIQNKLINKSGYLIIIDLPLIKQHCKKIQQLPFLLKDTILFFTI